jgi:AcrR family transcriptional regulator
MPISVDHDQRRATVISAAIRLIAKAGLEGVTVRDIADAVGCSTAVVSHYFHNKRELLFLTYRATIDRATERWEAVYAASKGDIRAYLAELMPLDEERLMEWQEIAEAQRQCVIHARAQILRALDALHARGHLRPEVDRAFAARRVLATITGMTVQVMFDPTDWPNERQHEVVDAELRPLFRPAHLPAELAHPTSDSRLSRMTASP